MGGAARGQRGSQRRDPLLSPELRGARRTNFLRRRAGQLPLVRRGRDRRRRRPGAVDRRPRPHLAIQPRLRHGRDVRARQDPVRGWGRPHRLAHAGREVGGADGDRGDHRSHRRLTDLAEHGPDVGAAASPQLDDPPGRAGARDGRHQGCRLRQHRPRARHARGGDVEPGHRELDDAGEQQQDARLPLRLPPPARRHGTARRQWRRAGHPAGRRDRSGPERAQPRDLLPALPLQGRAPADHLDPQRGLLRRGLLGGDAQRWGR